MVLRKRSYFQKQKQCKLTVDIRFGRRRTPCTVGEPNETPPAPRPKPRAASGQLGCAAKSETRKSIQSQKVRICLRWGQSLTEVLDI